MLNVRERRTAQAKREAADLIAEIGIERTANLLKVHTLTVRRWHSGEVCPGEPVLIALRTLAGRWGYENKSWEGWVIRGDWIWSPAGDKFHPGDLLGRQYQIQLIKHLQRKVQLLEKKLQSIDTGAANDPIGGDITEARAVKSQSGQLADQGRPLRSPRPARKPFGSRSQRP